MKLDDYIANENDPKGDQNLFWRLQSGEHQNLLDEAINRIEQLEHKLQHFMDCTCDRDITIQGLEQQLAERDEEIMNYCAGYRKENQRLRQALETIAQSAVLDSTGNCSPLLDDYCAYAALVLEDEEWPHGTAKWLQPASPPGN